MRPITVSNETYYSVKWDLLQCQMRPFTVSNETYYSVKRDLLVSNETYCPRARTGVPLSPAL